MKKNKVVKTYRSHQGSAFVMGFFSLIFAASFAVLFLFPAFTITADGMTTEYSGLEIIFLGLGEYIKMVFPDISLDKVDVVLGYMNNYAESGSNVIIKTICGFHSYIALAISILATVAVLLAVVVIVLGLVWFIRGRILIPKATTTIAHWSNALFDGCIGVLFGYLFLFGEAAKEAANPASFGTATFPFVALGIQAVTLIIMRIVYAFCYKNRFYEDTKKSGKKAKQPKENAAKEGQQQIAQNDEEEVEEELVPLYKKGLPEGLTVVGDHSFAADDSLTNAIIPEGITTLGNGAFANCSNLELVTIPATVIKIGPNCFHNTPKLKTINYTGTKEDWRTVRRGVNWLVGAGTTVINTRDGAIGVNPNQ